jgi:hypothetical protein
VLPGDLPDDLTETHHGAGSHRRANWLVLGQHAVRVRDHHDAAPGDGAGEAHLSDAGGEDLLAWVGGQVDAAVSRRVCRRRRLERPDDPNRSGGRPVNARRESGRTRPDGGRRGISGPRYSAAANVAPAARDANAATARSNTRTD